jgi:hypothetical protein
MLLLLCFVVYNREKISQTFRDALGDTYSSSNPYKRKRRNFEKKHNVTMDVVRMDAKRRRGSSPTSVVMASPRSSTAPSPEPTEQQLMPQTPTSPPQISPQIMRPSLMNMMRPGQIGFARRSMLQFGGMMKHRHAMLARRGSPARSMPAPGMMGMRRPMPHFAPGRLPPMMPPFPGAGSRRISHPPFNPLAMQLGGATPMMQPLIQRKPDL